MNVFVAKNAGFCFGVRNAVETTIKHLEKGEKVYTYGPIIHNETVVKDLEQKGAEIVTDLSRVKENDLVVIRSHGISKKEYDMLYDKKAEIVDTTCPNVERIHKIVEKKCSEGYKIVIIGDRNHPEVKGIAGWCEEEAVIIGSEEEITNLPDNTDKICIVSQTTFNMEKWHELTSKLLYKASETLVYNTLCNATQLRQKEALELSKNMDLMIIVGGKHSSNTTKLFELCNKNCNTFLVEDENDINLGKIDYNCRIGVAAGTSTPEYVINKVVEKIKNTSEEANKMEEINNIDNTEEKAIENKQEDAAVDTLENREETMEDIYSFYDNIYVGNIIEGKVILINDKELFVDIGYKADGILPLEEASFETINLKEKYKYGDTITVEVIKMNDGEGNVVLSRKAVEKEEYFGSIKKMKENGTQIDVAVVSSNKGGFSCQYGEISAFMPHSLSGLSRQEDPESLIGKKVKVQINDLKEKRNEIELVVSRKEIVNAERQIKVDNFIQKVQDGDVYKGKVKSLIKVGAFINVESIDIFVPISEIAWKRINAPSDVLKENQIVDVLVIKVDSENKRVTGSIKRTGVEPFEKFVLEHNEGDTIEGKVARFTDFGAFIEIADGVDGLLHISNISEKHINKPQDEIKLGQILKLKVIKIDKESKRISLSLKDVEKDAE